MYLNGITLLIIFHCLFSQFKCCGVTNKTDWYDVLNGTLPSSCCSVGTDQCVDGWSEVCLLLSYKGSFWSTKSLEQWCNGTQNSQLSMYLCFGVMVQYVFETARTKYIYIWLLGHNSDCNHNLFLGEKVRSLLMIQKKSVRQ